MKKANWCFVFLLPACLQSVAQSTIFPFDSQWKYLDNGINQGTDWRSPDFTDTSWKTGTGWFGYGQTYPEIKTILSYGADPLNKQVTTYFRKAFTISGFYLYQNFTANIRRDDGIVLYLNGSEIYRNNMPDGAITYPVLANAKGDNGLKPVTIAIDKNALKSGTNLLAAEVHQYKRTDVDVVFALSMTGDKSVTTDSVAPVISSIKRLDPLTAVTSASTLKFRVTFSEKVYGVDAKDFTFPGYNPARGRIVSLLPVGSSGTTYDITVHPVTGTGTLGISFTTNETGITDAAGNKVKKLYQTLETYTIQAPTGVLLSRGPYLQVGSQTGVTLRWRTNLPTDSRVQVGTVFGTYTQTVTDATSTNEHQVRVNGLKPNTRYYYRFGSSSQVLQAGVDNYFKTAPGAADTTKTAIAIFGDCGRKDNRANVLSAYQNYVNANPAAMMLALGDNAYEDGSDSDYQREFFEPYESSILKNHVLFPAPGNHEYHTTLQTSREAPYFKNFTVPGNGECGGVPSKNIAYYSFDWGNIHFVSLDSYGKEGPDQVRMYDTLSPQVTWLKKDLEANTKPWVIAFWHHPPYTMGSRNSDIEDELRKIRENFIRIIERYGVDLVLCGHSHVYERSYLLNGYYGREAEFDITKNAKTSSSGKNDGTPNSAAYRTVTGSGNHGTVYVVSGSSSKAGPIDEKFPHNATPFAFNTEGMLYLEINQNRLDARFIEWDNTIGDRFTIIHDTATLAKPVPMTAAKQLPGLKVFPTLVNRGNEVTVTYDGDAAGEITVIDMHGSVVANYRFQNATRIKTAGMPAGTYLLRLTAKRGTSYKRFVVVQ